MSGQVWTMQQLGKLFEASNASLQSVTIAILLIVLQTAGTIKMTARSVQTRHFKASLIGA